MIRISIRTFPFSHSAGGLVTAVAPVVVETGGLWVGWPGLHLEDNIGEIPESSPGDNSPTAGLKSDNVSSIKKRRARIFHRRSVRRKKIY